MMTKISFLKFWAIIGGRNMVILSVIPEITATRITETIANIIVIWTLNWGHQCVQSSAFSSITVLMWTNVTGVLAHNAYGHWPPLLMTDIWSRLQRFFLTPEQRYRTVSPASTDRDETPWSFIATEDSYQGTCEHTHATANTFEAFYQIYQAVEDGNHTTVLIHTKWPLERRC